MSEPAPNVANVDLGDLGDTPKSPSPPAQIEQVATTAMKPHAEKPRAEKPKVASASASAVVRPAMQSRSRSSMNGPLYMQTSNNKVLIRRVKRKGDGPMKSLARWFLENQTGKFVSQLSQPI